MWVLGKRNIHRRLRLRLRLRRRCGGALVVGLGLAGRHRQRNGGPGRHLRDHRRRGAEALAHLQGRGDGQGRLHDEANWILHHHHSLRSCHRRCWDGGCPCHGRELRRGAALRQESWPRRGLRWRFDGRGQADLAANRGRSCRRRLHRAGAAIGRGHRPVGRRGQVEIRREAEAQRRGAGALRRRARAAGVGQASGGGGGGRGRRAAVGGGGAPIVERVGVHVGQARKPRDPRRAGRHGSGAANRQVPGQLAAHASRVMRPAAAAGARAEPCGLEVVRGPAVAIELVNKVSPPRLQCVARHLQPAALPNGGCATGAGNGRHLSRRRNRRADA
mmetsp:Transcript_65256/g.199627  ORF Transcript_65256/g.199627 Transcript_65256/m.199627 type:complete len:332 (-) Transcript_65256:3-998(-)